jgi:hypothetical protein
MRQIPTLSSLAASIRTFPSRLITGPDISIVGVGLFARGGLILCSPSLYDDATLLDDPWRVIGFGLVSICLLALFAGHHRHEDLNSGTWFAADLTVHLAYAGLVSFGYRGAVDPVIFGPAITAACAGSRPHTRIAVVVPGLMFTGVAFGRWLGNNGTPTGIGLAIAQIAVAWSVTVTLIPIVIGKKHLLLTVAGSRSESDTQLARRIDRARRLTEKSLAEWARPVGSGGSRAELRQARAVLDRAGGEIAAALSDFTADVQNQAVEAGPASPDSGMRGPPRQGRNGLSRMLNITRRRQSRDRPLRLRGVLLEHLFVIGLSVRLWLVAQAAVVAGILGGLPGLAFSIWVAWSVFLALGWLYGHPFLADNGWRLLTGIDLMVAISLAFVVPSPDIKMTLPLLAASVALVAIRGWWPGLVAVVAAFVTWLVVLGVHGPDPVGNLQAIRAFGMFLLWGLVGGLAASALLRVARGNEASGHRDALLARQGFHDSDLRGNNLTRAELDGIEADGLEVGLEERVAIAKAHSDLCNQQAALVARNGSDVHGFLCVNRALGEWLTPLRDRVAVRGRRVEVRLSRVQPIVSREDAWQLAEIASELLANALLHTDADPIVVESRREGSWWVLRASGADTGSREHRPSTNSGLGSCIKLAARFGGRVDTEPPWELRVPLLRLWDRRPWTRLRPRRETKVSPRASGAD